MASARLKTDCRPPFGDDDELIAANPIDRTVLVNTTYGLAQGLDGDIPLFMTKPVVDFFELVQIDHDDGDELPLDEDRHDITDHADMVIAVDVRSQPEGFFRPQRPIVPVGPVHIGFAIGLDRRNGLRRKFMTRILAGIPETIGLPGQLFTVMEIIALDTIVLVAAL